MTDRGVDPTPAPPALREGRLRTSVLVGLVCFLVYNANLRAISAGDTYPARYLPFAILRYHTVLLDPIASVAAQGRGPGAFWIVPTPNGHMISLYPVVLPILVAPLYVPAVAYLDHTGWDAHRLDRVARIMEKLVASLLAAASAAVLHALLRRSVDATDALLLVAAYAFGTTTWVIGSQALWQHGLAELLICVTLLLLTGPPSRGRALAAGLCCGLLACNRPPDSLLAAALGAYGLRWAGRAAPALVAAAAAPVAMTLAYNFGAAGNVAGGYGLRGSASFFAHGLVPGIAGLLLSPTRGLFVFSPFLLFVPFVLRHALRDRATRGLTLALGIAVLLQVLLYAKADWRAGASWGPRWLTDLLPVLVWMLAPGFARMRGGRRIVFVVASGAAIAIEAIGAFWYTNASDAAIFAVDPAHDVMHAAWDVRNTPFIAELRHARAPGSLFVRVQGSLDTLTIHPRAAGGGADGIDVEGWALASGRSPRSVVIWLDGRAVASIVRFENRPDVVSALGERAPSGWRAEIPAVDLSPGDHQLGVTLQVADESDLRFVADRRFTVPAAGAPQEATVTLSSAARRAARLLASHQQAPGYWLTSYTSEPRFERPRVEMNTFVTSLLVDLLDPVAGATELADGVARARRHLADQIEDGGLVRYHGRPDAPTIGTLGCRITPDTDDTALVWRIAPGARPELRAQALDTIARYRRADGLYRTWLAERGQYECIDPGADSNPADVAIQMHLLLLLAKADPAAARRLCGAFEAAVGDDRIWVYYASAPLVPLLREREVRASGCPVRLPATVRLRAAPGQDAWLDVARLLDPAADGAAAAQAVDERLRSLAADDFAAVRRDPPLLYHNDLRASVRRYYWSEDVGYALWLRLYLRRASLR